MIIMSPLKIRTNGQYTKVREIKITLKRVLVKIDNEECAVGLLDQHELSNRHLFEIVLQFRTCIIQIKNS